MLYRLIIIYRLHSEDVEELSEDGCVLKLIPQVVELETRNEVCSEGCALLGARIAIQALED